MADKSEYQADIKTILFKNQNGAIFLKVNIQLCLNVVDHFVYTANMRLFLGIKFSLSFVELHFEPVFGLDK